MSFARWAVTAQPTVRHDAYVEFVRQAKIGWFVFADLLTLIALSRFGILSANPVLASALLVAVPLLSLFLVRRGVLEAVLAFERTPNEIRTTIGCVAIATASLLIALWIPKPAVTVWPFWFVPLTAASGGLVFNGWAQTRGNQLLSSYGIYAAVFSGVTVSRYGRSSGMAGFLLAAVIPFTVAAWARKVTGSLLSAFLVYFVSGEILWIAAQFGSAHK